MIAMSSSSRSVESLGTYLVIVIQKRGRDNAALYKPARDTDRHDTRAPPIRYSHSPSAAKATGAVGDR